MQFHGTMFVITISGHMQFACSAYAIFLEQICNATLNNQYRRMQSQRNTARDTTLISECDGAKRHRPRNSLYESFPPHGAHKQIIHFKRLKTNEVKHSVESKWIRQKAPPSKHAFNRDFGKTTIGDNEKKHTRVKKTRIVTTVKWIDFRRVFMQTSSTLFIASLVVYVGGQSSWQWYSCWQCGRLGPIDGLPLIGIWLLLPFFPANFHIIFSPTKNCMWYVV